MSTGIISTVAGGDIVGFSGDGGPATNAKMDYIYGIAVDNNFNIYIADGGNNRIRKVNATTGIISTIAGNGSNGFSGDGMAATTAQLYNPMGISVDKYGNVYIADYGNNVIRKINASGTISTIAGIFVPGYSGDGGTAILAQLNHPTRVSADNIGNVFIADFSNNRIRKITGATTYANNVNKLSDFYFYPNPAQHELTIISNETINTLSITNMIGEDIYSGEYNTNYALIDVSWLSKGVYLIRINGTTIRRFVKQ